MTSKSSMVISTILVVSILTSNLAGVADVKAFDTNDENGEYWRSERPAINPDFDPDESCLIDVWQEKCTLGSEQKCPEGFGGNQYGTCYLKHPEGCPEGYHGEEGDESGQCLPNDEGCHGDYVMNDEQDYCYDPMTWCPENPDAESCQTYEGLIACPSSKPNEKGSIPTPQTSNDPACPS